MPITIPDPYPRRSAINAILLCGANWLLPGIGYVLVGDRTRGWLLFASLNACLVAGFALGAGIVVPPSLRSPNGSIVTWLTFIAQSFHGGGMLLSLAGQKFGGALGFFGGNPGATYADLGTLHLLVAGGTNYFGTVRLWDLLAGNPDHDRASEKAAPASPGDNV